MNLQKHNLQISSKRIAEKTSKEHKHVIRDIKAMVSELTEYGGPNLDHDEFQEITDSRGYVSEIFLNERLSLCLASGYSVALRMVIIDEWASLKNQTNTGYSLPQTYAEALRQLAESVEAKEAMEKQLEAAKPKIEFFNAVTGSKDAIEMGNAAKVLDIGIGRNKMFARLRELKILRSNNEPYQEFIDRGYFRVVEQKFADNKGEIHITFKTLVYQKGLDFIRKTLSKKNL
jgi:anti-repressor protein